MRILLNTVLAFLLVPAGASVVFALRTPPPVTTPRIVGLAPPGPVSSDLARFDRGARVRVSSWDLHRRRHPLFVIDAEPRPTPLEAWSPRPSDAAPWLEVILNRPSHVGEVVLVFAPRADSRPAAVPGYVLSCMAGGKAKKRWQSPRSNQARAVHQAAHGCDGVDRIRLELRADAERDVSVHLYEVEVRR